MSVDEKVVLAIRVRGQVRVKPQIEDTLNKLQLIRLHNAKLLTLSPSLQGMITKAKDYITWGEVEADLIELLLSKRGRLSGNRRLTDEYVKNNSDYSSISAFAKALATGKARITDVEGVKPIFRLTPPKKGFRGKKYYPIGMGGITGYRGPKIK
ncbi:MAG: 50S ribosomal protein L30, partial [Candidatus Thorarchaeota archaeon]